jgi:molecular chaperone GrpE
MSEKEKKAKEKEKSDIESLKKELKECKKLCNEYLAGWQRARADFLNYKKQELERIKELGNLTRTELILKILPILDNLERAKSQIPEDLKNSDWVEGILQIENQFRNFLQEEGVEEIKAEGEKFDPNFHEAVEEIETKDKKSGEILEVLEKGYLFRGQLLRPAKVKVVK